MRYARHGRAINESFTLALICALLIATAFAGDAVARARRQRRAVLAPSREEVLEAERLLSELGYWTGEADGKWDAVSRQALVAFQKVERRDRTGVLTLEELQALRGASRPRPLEGGPAHVEVDISRQVLFFVDDAGVVTKILPVSTGSGARYSDRGEWAVARTPRGRFAVERKVSGWRRGHLGLMYYPDYFHEGFAIHGSLSVPAYPASHGCVRIPVFAAREFSEMVPIGTPVIVHDGS
ncbi:MAG TPA: L,D-transpeptidase family protein [Pyrinomonadaceae bacterium]|jgi:hypothetical protein|nr:L,D-transpeptidase family protein [Pyrinomonadaceae bacterium]